MIIKSGYRLSVTSWENDADNYQTKVLDGLTKEHCQFLVDICKAFHQDSEFANMYEPSVKERKAFIKVFKSILAKHNRQKDRTDYLYELGLSGEDFFTRVCEEYTVEYVPNDIELKDVTADF